MGQTWDCFKIEYSTAATVKHSGGKILLLACFFLRLELLGQREGSYKPFAVTVGTKASARKNKNVTKSLLEHPKLILELT